MIGTLRPVLEESVEESLGRYLPISSALAKKVAISARVSDRSGQNSVLSGGLQPTVIPLSSRALIESSNGESSSSTNGSSPFRCSYPKARTRISAISSRRSGSVGAVLGLGAAEPDAGGHDRVDVVLEDGLFVVSELVIRRRRQVEHSAHERCDLAACDLAVRAVAVVGRRIAPSGDALLGDDVDVGFMNRTLIITEGSVVLGFGFDRVASRFADTHGPVGVRRRIHHDVSGCVDLPVEVRDGVLSVAGVADRTDELAFFDLDAGDDAIGDPPTVSVVGVGAVGAVRCRCSGGGSASAIIIVKDRDDAAPLRVEICRVGRPIDPFDDATAGSDHGDALDHIGTDVDALARAPAAAGRPEGVRIGEVDAVHADDPEGERAEDLMSRRSTLRLATVWRGMSHQGDDEGDDDDRTDQTRVVRCAHCS